MDDDRQPTDGGLLGKARRLADDALEYARSDEARARFNEARRKAIEVGEVASAGATDLAKKAGRAASEAKGKVEAFSKSERAGEIRTRAKGLWDRSKVIEVWGIPLFASWKHPAWTRKKAVMVLVAVVGVTLGMIAQSRDKKDTTVATADAHLAPVRSGQPPEMPNGSAPGRSGATTRVADLAAADASSLTPGNVMAVLEPMASQIEPLDVRAIDYTHGPKGETILSRPGKDLKTGKETTDSGYLAADGRFRLHGLRTSWYGPATTGAERKKFQEIYYFDGQPHGAVRNWYESGEKQSEMTMRRGKRHGLAISYLGGGAVVQASLWEDGTANGPHCDWYRSGTIRTLKSFKNGAAQGGKKSWFEDGRPESECRYVDGRRQGELVEWSPGGKVVRTQWKDGEVPFAPGAANKRSFYFKLIDVANLHDPNFTNFEFESPFEFLGVFGRPQRGSLDFGPDAGDPASPRMWSYRCSNGTLDLRVVYIIPQRSFHVLIDPSATME